VAAIEELSADERAWIDAHLVGMREANVDVNDPASLGALFDEALAAWYAQPEQDRPDPNPLINSLGVGLGQCIVARTDLRWVIATDENGTDLALHRIANDVLVFPANAVAKRWSARVSGFIPAFVDELTSALDELPPSR
jgi:hypothetical protein